MNPEAGFDGAQAPKLGGVVAAGRPGGARACEGCRQGRQCRPFSNPEWLASTQPQQNWGYPPVVSDAEVQPLAYVPRLGRGGWYPC